MIIAVGSTNTTKLEAVHRALHGEPNIQGYAVFLQDDIKQYDINSKVSAQPLSFEEIIRGAMNRAQGAFTQAQKEGTCRFSVGIESGLNDVPLLFHPDGSQRYEEKTYCFLYDGKKYYFGSSAGFEHPKAVIDCVLREGVDISEAYRRCKFTNSPKIGKEKGCVNLLTNGRVTRDQEIADAVRRALIALENTEMYQL